MGTLYLVRHGQASFGEADYDRLSPLGHAQSQRLGAYFAARARRFDAILTGSLRRHAETWAGIVAGAQWDAAAAPTPHIHPGLDEYDSHALLQALPPQTLAPPHTPEGHRQHFRLLRDALAQWMAGVIAPAGMPSWDEFAARVRNALEAARQHHEGDVLIVSSGGPIATAATLVLGAPAETMIELNMRLRNTSVSTFNASARHHRLLTWNTLPHLEDVPEADWVSYA